MKPKIAILTNLTDASPAYSLVSIILQQARYLKRAGYETDLLVLRNFKGADRERLEKDPDLNVKFVLPQTILVDYQPTQKAEEDHEKDGKKILGFESQAKIHLEGNGREKGFMEILEPYDTVIDHDLMFLSWFLPMNKALRAVMEAYPQKNYLHWVHSRPSNPPSGTCYPSTLRYEAGPGTYVYLNDTDRQWCSIIFGIPMSRVAVVYNAKDIRDLYSFQDETKTLIDEYNLMDHQILQVYPFSTPRWRDKGVRQLLKIWGCWRRQGIRARLILVTAHSNSAVDKPRIKAIEEYVQKCGLRVDDDVIITHRFANLIEGRDKERAREWGLWRYCVPATVVRDLMLLSNIFVFPTDSEVCSLIQAEAAVAGKILVLNDDFPPLRDFAPPTVLKYNFKVNDPDSCHPDYYPNVARELWRNLQSESAFHTTTYARTKCYNADWIFKNQLEPLLWHGFAQKVSRAPKPEPQYVSVAEVVDEGPTHTIPIKPTVIEVKKKKPSYDDPQPGMECPIFGECSPMQKERCYGEAGHCLMLDQEVKVK